jgi:flagellar assembly factor FliW
MRVQSRKFNTTLEVHEDQIIRFPRGLIGLANETEFVLLEREQSPRIAWLQSLKDPDLALPVVSSHDLAEEYPDVPLDGGAVGAELPSAEADTAVMVVLTCQHGMPPTVNLMSPIVVDADRRVGQQVILRGSRFASRELLALRPVNDSVAAQAAGGAP